MKHLLISFLFFHFVSLAQDRNFIITSEGDLYSVNLLNCTKSFRGNCKHVFADIAFTEDGKLWGIGDSGLYSIDTLTAKCKFIKEVYGSVSLVGLGDTLLISDSKLFSTNPNSNFEKDLGYIGFSSSGDLTWFNDVLYMSAENLIEIKLNKNKDSIISVKEIENNFSTSSALGLTTTHLNSSSLYSTIVGFYCPGEFYQICNQNGYKKQICPNLTLDCIYGAASLTYKLENSNSNECMISSVKDIESEIEIFPTIITSNAQIRNLNITKNYRLNLFNILGKNVKTFDSEHQTDVIFNKLNIPSGNYFLEVSADDFSIRKIIKLTIL